MNIFISNLSYRVVESDLKELFGHFGEVTSTKVVIDAQTGRSKCFGFVNMTEKEAVQDAITKLHRTMYDGKIINVTEARSQEERPAKGGNGGKDRKRNNDENFGEKFA